MSSIPVLRQFERGRHNLTTISVFDSLVISGLLCIAIWSLIALTILGT